jgi:hypothetical protein
VKIGKFIRIVSASIAAMAMAVVVSVGVKPVAATDPGESITISPLVKTIDITAGESMDDSFTITNNGTTNYTFNVYASPLTVNNDTYTQSFDEKDANNFSQIYRWVTFDQTEYSLSAGDHVDIPFHVNVPASIPNGGQYAVLFAQVKAKESSTGGVQSTTRVGVTLRAHGDGETINKGNVSSSTLGKLNKDSNQPVEQKGPWFNSGPVYGLTRVENTGNTDFELKTKVTLTSFFGDKVIATSVEQTRQLLPDTTYLATDHVGCTDADTEQGAVCVKMPWIGLFHLKTEVSFLGKTETFKHTVFVFPLWLLLMIIVAIFLLVLFWIYRKANRKKRKGNLKIKKGKGTV